MGGPVELDASLMLAVTRLREPVVRIAEKKFPT